jgi:hypothetical protein
MPKRGIDLESGEQALTNREGMLIDAYIADPRLLHSPIWAASIPARLHGIDSSAPDEGRASPSG